MTKSTVSEDFQEDIDSIQNSLKGYETLILKIESLKTTENSKLKEQQMEKLTTPIIIFQTMISTNIQVLYERIEDLYNEGEIQNEQDKKILTDKVDIIREKFEIFKKLVQVG